MLRDAVPGIPRSVGMAVAPLFAFTVASVIVGQTSPLIFF